MLSQVPSLLSLLILSSQVIQFFFRPWLKSECTPLIFGAINWKITEERRESLFGAKVAQVKWKPAWAPLYLLNETMIWKWFWKQNYLLRSYCWNNMYMSEKSWDFFRACIFQIWVLLHLKTFMGLVRASRQATRHLLCSWCILSATNVFTLALWFLWGFHLWSCSECCGQIYSELEGRLLLK